MAAGLPRAAIARISTGAGLWNLGMRNLSYTQKMDLITLFYLITAPISQPILWLMGAPKPWRPW